MTTDEKIAAILATIQTDPGNRGLASDPKDNLFTAFPGDFASACLDIARAPNPVVAVVTGFFIPTSNPAAFETDGTLGAFFLQRALTEMRIPVAIQAEQPITVATTVAAQLCRLLPLEVVRGNVSHLVAIERSGPALDKQHYTMRGRDITSHLETRLTQDFDARAWGTTIGIGDGGNEIGMGKIPHETIVKNIPNGDLIHCRVSADHLIVAGVSNWGAYALAAGVYVLRGIKPPSDLFDPDREQEILEVMVREGPLVDGVTGKQTATVDGLTWDEYVKPLIRIREILES